MKAMKKNISTQKSKHTITGIQFIILLVAASISLAATSRDPVLIETENTVQASSTETVLQKSTLDSITLAWQDSADNEEGFIIEYKRDNENWTEMHRTDPDMIQYGPFTLQDPGMFSFRVCAFNYFGKSNYTNTVYVALTCPAPQEPSLYLAERIGSNQLLLSWEASSNADGYHIYRSFEPNFEPDYENGTNRLATFITDIYPDKNGIQWIDENAGMKDPEQNYFYVITAVNSSGQESKASVCIGEFDFQLKTTPTTSFNQIALPFDVEGIQSAEDLMDAIPHCDAIARWNAQQQSYEQFLPQIPVTNFNVQAGHTYYVNVKKDTILNFVGKACQTNYMLETTSSTNFNEIMLPFEKKTIKKASELMQDIPNCNSIAFWDADLQGFVQYIPGIISTDFSVRQGHPYFVHVTEETAWPYQNIAKTTSASQDENNTPAVGSSAPHVVWGSYTLQDTTLAMQGLKFTAHISGNSEDILTETSPGCLIEDGYWLVQCAAFSSPWKEDDTLKVTFYAGEEEINACEVILSYNPEDQAENLILDEACCETGILDFDSSFKSFTLSQNYPNPFNPETVIPYQLPQNSRVNIVVYNMMGQQVRTLVQETMEAGSHQIVWDGLNDQGAQVSSDVYLVSMRTESFSQTMKVTLIR